MHTGTLLRLPVHKDIIGLGHRHKSGEAAVMVSELSITKSSFVNSDLAGKGANKALGELVRLELYLMKIGVSRMTR